MKIIDVIGIDVSKLTLDVFIHKSKSYLKCNNTEKDFKKLCNWALSETKIEKENLLFIFEHTGIYSYKLAVFLQKNDFKFKIVPGLETKKSLGISRGKNDKVDAKKIARYAYRLRDEISITKLPSEDLRKLKALLSLRDRLVKQRAGYKASLKEMKRIYKMKDNQILFNIQKSMIKKLDSSIKKIEDEMFQVLSSNQDLEQLYTLITSIKGVGTIVALYMIVLTEGFKKFKTYRQFSSYCGTAPFPNKSGTSIKGRTKISHLANKKMKALLDLAAKSAIQYNTELKVYYKKRVDEGKNKRSTINIIRNKILSRIFAVVNRQSPYVDIMKFAV